MVCLCAIPTRGEASYQTFQACLRERSYADYTQGPQVRTMMNRNDLEQDLLECRRLITRAVTDHPEFSSMEKIRADYLEFLRRCDAVHKEAQILLVRNILAIEAELEGLKGQPKTRESS